MFGQLVRLLHERHRDKRPILRRFSVLDWMTRRFGPLPQEVLDRLARAGSAQLETWADRVIDAASLDEVFAES